MTANTAEDPVIIAPKENRALNIDYIQLVHGIMLQAQIDALEKQERLLNK